MLFKKSEISYECGFYVLIIISNVYFFFVTHVIDFIVGNLLFVNLYLYMLEQLKVISLGDHFEIGNCNLLTAMGMVKNGNNR